MTIEPNITLGFGDRLIIGDCWFKVVKMSDTLVTLQLIGPTEEEQVRREITRKTGRTTKRRPMSQIYTE